MPVVLGRVLGRVLLPGSHEQSPLTCLSGAEIEEGGVWGQMLAWEEFSGSPRHASELCCVWLSLLSLFPPFLPHSLPTLALLPPSLSPCLVMSRRGRLNPLTNVDKLLWVRTETVEGCNGSTCTHMKRFSPSQPLTPREGGKGGQGIRQVTRGLSLRSSSSEGW